MTKELYFIEMSYIVCDRNLLLKSSTLKIYFNPN